MKQLACIDKLMHFTVIPKAKVRQTKTQYAFMVQF